jgi:hypothetical protein
LIPQNSLAKPPRSVLLFRIIKQAKNTILYFLTNLPDLTECFTKEKTDMPVTLASNEHERKQSSTLQQVAAEK